MNQRPINSRRPQIERLEPRCMLAGVLTDTLTEDQLAAAVDEAKARWNETGLSGVQQAKLNSLQFELADLQEILSTKSASTVRIDPSLAADSWFVESAPHDDQSFNHLVRAGRIEATEGDANRGVDLLSVVSENMRLHLANTESAVLSSSDAPTGQRLLPDELGPQWWTGVDVKLDVASTAAAWLDEDWRFRREVELDHSHTEAIRWSQLEIKLDSSNFDFGKAAANGADIRVTDADGVTLVDHWIEHWDREAQSAYVIVEVPLTPANASHRLYVYYGNEEAASTSNWKETFTNTTRIQRTVADQQPDDAFPSIERLQNGDLLAVFRGGTEHATQDGKIYISRSTNNGDTWSTSLLYDDPSLDDRVNLGMKQLRDGTILVPFVQYDADIGEHGEPTDSFVLRSNDNGATWSEPTPIQHPFEKWNFPYGKLVELPNGMILMPVYGEHDDGARDIALLQSTDGGVQWELRSIIDSKSPGGGFGEASVLQVSEQRFIAVYRDRNEIYQRTSNDGAATWGPERKLFDGVSPELVRLQSGEILMCVGDRHRTKGIRCHLSSDSGETWSRGAMIDRSTAKDKSDNGYPSTVQFPDGRLLTVFYDETQPGNLDIDSVVYDVDFLRYRSNQIEGVESGDLSNWHAVAGDTTEATDVESHSGTHSLMLDDRDSTLLNVAMRPIYEDPRSEGTVSFWARLDSQSPRGGVFWLGDGIDLDLDRRFLLDYTSDGAIRYYRGNRALPLPQPTKLPLDQWHKFTIRFDANRDTAEVLINGRSRGAIAAMRAGDAISYFGAGSWGGRTTGDRLFVDDVYTSHESPAPPQISIGREASRAKQTTFLLDSDDPLGSVTFTAGLEVHRLTVNGESYSIDASNIGEIHFSDAEAASILGIDRAERAEVGESDLQIVGWDYRVVASGVAQTKLVGNGGADSAFVQDSTGDDRLLAHPKSMRFSGQGFSHQLTDWASFTVTASDGDDQARIFDSAGDDSVVSRVDYAFMQGDGFLAQVNGFDSVRFFASTGDDRADLFDSPQADRYVARPTYAYMQNESNVVQVEGFDRVTAHSHRGGGDEAMLFDSTSDDAFVGRTSHSYLQGSDYVNEARGFPRVTAYASTGQDTATLHGSPSNDQFVGRPTHSYLVNANVLNQVNAFDQVVAVSESGGDDSAMLYDSPDDDALTARPDYAFLTGPGYLNEVRGFQTVTAYAGAGDDRAKFSDSPGIDQFIGRATNAYMTNGSYLNEAVRFESVRAISTSGDDNASLFGAPGPDRFVARPTYAYLASPTSVNQVDHFRRVTAHGQLGDNDRAELIGSAGDDRIVASPTNFALDGPSYHYTANSFARVDGWGMGAATADQATLAGSSESDTFVSRRTYDYIQGSNYLHQVNGFQRVNADGRGGVDQANFFHAESADHAIADGSMADLIRPLKHSTVDAFDAVRLFAELGESPTIEERPVDYLLQRVGTWLDV